MHNMVNKAALYYTVDALAALATGWFADACIRRGLAVGMVRKAGMALGWTTAATGFLGCASAGPHSYLAWLMVAAVGFGIGWSRPHAQQQSLRCDIASINRAPRVVVLADRCTFQGEPREHALGTGVGQDLRIHLPVRTGLGVPSNGTGCSRSVRRPICFS